MLGQLTFEEDTSPGRIMIVDDTPENLLLLKDLLTSHGCEVYALPSGPMALRAAERYPPELILLDITMPVMNGYQVCAQLKANPQLCDIPVIFLSALNAIEDKIKGFAVGGCDYITKPFQFEEVQSRVETHLKLYRLRRQLDYQNSNLQKLVDTKVRELTDSQLAMIFALAKLSENRDQDTGAHLERVREYCRLLAERLMLDSPYSNLVSPHFVSVIYFAAPLHDIGKIAIPDHILLKPDKLNEDEFTIMKTHAMIGEQTLCSIDHFQKSNTWVKMGIDIAGGHHERWDGKGYPRHLSGEMIPLSARIMAVADIYDALRSERCYKKPFDQSEVVEIIRKSAGTQLDPIVVNSFIELASEFNDIRLSMV